MDHITKKETASLSEPGSLSLSLSLFLSPRVCLKLLFQISKHVNFDTRSILWLFCLTDDLKVRELFLFKISFTTFIHRLHSRLLYELGQYTTRQKDDVAIGWENEDTFFSKVAQMQASLKSIEKFFS